MYLLISHGPFYGLASPTKRSCKEGLTVNFFERKNLFTSAGKKFVHFDSSTKFALQSKAVFLLKFPGIPMNTNFDAWLNKQFAEGLVDIKFAVMAGRGVSVEAIQDELLAAEASISAGFLKNAPQPTSMIPDDIASIIKQTVH